MEKLKVRKVSQVAGIAGIACENILLLWKGWGIGENMNEKKVKKLRKAVYGKDGSHKVREYKVNQRTGVLTDVGKRGEYQKAKKIRINA